MPKIEAKSKQMFSLWVNEVDRAYRILETDIANTIKRYRMLGMSDESIFKELSTSLDNGMNVFQDFKGYLGGSTDSMISAIGQMESNENLKGMGGAYKWELDPTAQDHCDTCSGYSGKVKSFEEWESLGLPGYGTTDCGVYCKCTLTVAV